MVLLASFKMESHVPSVVDKFVMTITAGIAFALSDSAWR